VPCRTAPFAATYSPIRKRLSTLKFSFVVAPVFVFVAMPVPVSCPTPTMPLKSAIVLISRPWPGGKPKRG